jgi:hypothetical protein
MGKSTNVHIVLNSRDATGGNGYNALLFNAENQNIVQGDIRHISVSEVNFPYDIPNVQAGFNTFQLFTDQIGASGTVLDIVVPPGFYTGTELATAISTAIATIAAPIPTVNIPVLAYNATSNIFTFSLPVGATPTLQWFVASTYTYPLGLTGVNAAPIGKDMLSILGYLPTQRGGNPYISLTAGGGNGGPFPAAESAPLIFTQYIDICSPQLCKFQYLRDGSTTNLARRSDVICRLYIVNNIALRQTDPEGVRPFSINRQFYNARTMKWTADNSVGTIDINLYDDIGQPLTTTWTPRPYQITFNVVENVRDEGLGQGMY